MKKKLPEQNLINRYRGLCTTCGEVYEAESKSDDLEGITFKCRKLMCTGRVVLDLNSVEDLSLTSNPLLNDQKEAKPDGSRRFC